MRAGVLAAVAMVALTLLYALFDPTRGLSTWLSLRAAVARSEARVARLKAEAARLRLEREALEANDPLTLERAVREELDWTRPGEILVRLPEPTAELERASGGAAASSGAR